MTGMMRTNQERNHPSRCLYEVSEGAKCDREYTTRSLNMQTIRAVSVLGPRLWHTNCLCRDVPAAGQQPLSQNSRVGSTLDGSYKVLRAQIKNKKTKTKTTFYQWFKHFIFIYFYFFKFWVLAKLKTKTIFWDTGTERIWLIPALRSLWLNLTRQWVSGFDRRKCCMMQQLGRLLSSSNCKNWVGCYYITTG